MVTGIDLRVAECCRVLPDNAENSCGDLPAMKESS
jgi:hypothetical protein